MNFFLNTFLLFFRHVRTLLKSFTLNLTDLSAFQRKDMNLFATTYLHHYHAIKHYRTTRQHPIDSLTPPHASHVSMFDLCK